MIKRQVQAAESTALLVSVVLCLSAASYSMASELKIAQLPSPLSQLGEGPVWDTDTQSLFYVDIMGAAILRYDYAENKTYSATIDGVAPISLIILVQGKPDQYVLGTGHTLTLVSWDGRSEKATFEKTIGDLGESEKHVRFNDGKVDPQGRLYAGTMRLESMGDIFDQKEGKFYRFDGNVGGKFYEQKRDISISNGLTWDEQTGKFYYIDSAARDIKEFDVLENGDLRNETVLFDLKVGGKNPDFVADGMTSDADGKLFVATWGGSKLLKINPKTKKVEQEIPIPAKQVTSAAFGGPKLDELFVTTAHTNNQDAPAGALFKVSGLGVKGKEMYKMILKE
ncbi:regucalcin-like [Malaya genurostris]|uniref:regucalcin-like n=1 Tax=Malaya genurostris TaxID=325434 RepID=UPI0026F3C81E|nr:regucalcin-like [Malaya genurostris]